MTYALGSHRRQWIGIGALTLMVTAFLAYSLPPYFTGGTRVPATFALHYPLLVAHVMFATVAMAAAVVQIWPGLRRRRPLLHRRTGRAYVAAAVPAGMCGWVLGAATPFGPILLVSNVVMATLWLWFTVNGYLAARRRQYAEHRRHMARSVALTFSIITNRIWTPILVITLYPLQDSVFHGNEEHFLWLVAGLTGWLGWTVPLVAVQWWLNRNPVPTLSSIPRKADTSRV